MTETTTTTPEKAPEKAPVEKPFSFTPEASSPAAGVVVEQPEVKPAKPTHFLTLACGDSFTTASPCASHHYCSDHGTLPVVNRAELGEE